MIKRNYATPPVVTQAGPECSYGPLDDIWIGVYGTPVKIAIIVKL